MSDAWDQDDEHCRADFLHMLARWEQDSVERSIEVAEASLARVSSGGVPMPNTAHPALERYADTVRGANIDPIRLPVIHGISAAFRAIGNEIYPTAALPEPLVLERRKCAAPAPFVGDPQWMSAVYAWPVWVDNYGRHVAGDAAMVFSHK